MIICNDDVRVLYLYFYHSKDYIRDGDNSQDRMIFTNAGLTRDGDEVCYNIIDLVTFMNFLSVCNYYFLSIVGLHDVITNFF